MRSLIKDSLAVLLSAIIFTSAGWLFYTDINSTLQNTGGEEIGMIMYKKNTAQRKYTGRAVWENIDTAAPVYSNDTIRTSTDSEAVVLMNDGTEIVLQDNSLIVLEWNEKEKNIAFLGGNISAKNETQDITGVKIKSADAVISLNDASINLQGEEGNIDLSVLKGNIDVSKGKITQEIKANQKASIAEGSDDFLINEIMIRPDTPEDNMYLLTFINNKKVDFSWNFLRPVADPVLTIARDMDFENIVEVKDIKDIFSYDKDLSEGTYYWQIKSKTDPGLQGPLRRFVVINDKYPELLTPTEGIEIKYRKDLPKLRFLWEQGIFPEHYLLEVSMDQDFTEKVLSEKVKGNFHFLDTLSEGRYFWKLTPFYALGNIGYAKNKNFQPFEIIHTTALEPVQLVFPPNNTAITTIESSKGIKFKWKEEAEITSYQFYLSDSPSFSSTLFNEPLSATSFTAEESLAPGTYYWKLGGVTNDNEILPHSQYRTLTIKESTGKIELTNPLDNDHFEIEMFGNRTFTWDSTVGEKYRFSLYKDTPDSSPIIEDYVAGKSRKTMIPATGEYFWQVSVVDDNNKSVIDSRIYSFRTRTPLKNPEIINPSPEVSLSIIGDDTLDFSWEKVYSADHYSLDIVRGSDGKKIGSADNIKETEFSFKNTRNLTEGKYTAILKAYKEAEMGWDISESGETAVPFTIGEIVIYDPPVLLSPGNNSVTGLEEVLNGNFIFEWTQSPMLAEYEITVSESFDFNRNLSVFNAEGLRYRPADIKPGEYFWKVKGIDSKRYSSPESGVSSFIIEKIKPLLNPVITSPYKNETVNMDNFDALYFKWKRSPEAEYYIVKLFSKNSSTALFSDENFKGTEIEFSQLEKLDTGDFILSVQAVKDLPDNKKRQSIEVRQNFSLSLTEPTEDIEIITVDEQFIF